MFIQENIVLFGKSAVRIRSESGLQSMIVIPEAGGHLASLKFDGVEIIDGFQSEQELLENAWGKSGLLYPFPNRLKNGAFQFKGQRFQFPINEDDTGHALHGFGMQQQMKIEEITLAETAACIKLAFNYDGHLDYYPWPFKLTVEYVLKGGRKFEMNLTAKNTGKEEMPFGMGWHPYFLIQDKGANTFLQLPKMQKVEIDDSMIPTGSKIDFEDFVEEKNIGNFLFDTGFEIPENGRYTKVNILNFGRNTLTYWQESRSDQFRFLQVFIPPSRNSIALEPMTCNIDALNNKEGLWILAAGAERSINCGLEQ